jgi:hypothetical protein
MQFLDLFKASGGLVESVKIVFFRMLSRGAQIQKVSVEINSGVLNKYGKMAGNLRHEPSLVTGSHSGHYILRQFLECDRGEEFGRVNVAENITNV